MSSVLSIESLPPEVLLHVFSFLSPAYLSETVSQVCTHWQDLCGDPLLYRELKFRQGEVSEKTVINILKVAPLLQSLTLVNWKHMNTILEVVSQNNRKIRVLILEKSGPSAIIFSKVMQKILVNCTELETLKLGRCIVRSKEFYKNLCIQLPHLKALLKDSGNKFVKEIMERIANSNFNLDDLENLNLQNSYIHYNLEDYDTAIALCERYCKVLRSLGLGNVDWSLEAFAALKKCHRLETLGIMVTPNISAEGLLTITSIPTLRHLELRHCLLPEAIWVWLFSSDGWKNLLSLDLRHSNVTDRAAVAIGEHLKNLETLTLDGQFSWDVEVPWLTTSGLRSVMQGCAKLRHLKLYHFDQTIEEAIQLIPQYLPGLRSLFIFPRANVAVEQIKTLMPELQVKFYQCIPIYKVIVGAKIPVDL